MTRRSLTLLIIVAVPLALVFSFTLRADPPRAAGQTEDLFSGKILVLNERSNAAFGATLEEVHVTRLGDQTFLVGKGFDADEGKGWYNGRTVWVPLNEVSQIVEFQDRGDLIKASENRRAAAK